MEYLIIWVTMYLTLKIIYHLLARYVPLINYNYLNFTVDNLFWKFLNRNKNPYLTILQKPKKMMKLKLPLDLLFLAEVSLFNNIIWLINLTLILVIWLHFYLFYCLWGRFDHKFSYSDRSSLTLIWIKLKIFIYIIK